MDNQDAILIIHPLKYGSLFVQLLFEARAPGCALFIDQNPSLTVGSSFTDITFKSDPLSHGNDWPNVHKWSISTMSTILYGAEL